MAVNAKKKWTYAKQVEKEIQMELDNKKKIPSVEHMNDLMTEFRNTCLETILLDFRYATEQKVEERLWATHSKLKERHKKLVSRVEEKEPKNLVEIRKVQKRYADFIKTSQHFYKGYIQRLASTYSGMKGLRRIAHRLSLETLAADDLIDGGPELEKLLDASCHATLLHLGDLSRYRNEFRVKDRSWLPALGYYGLASDLCPENGSAHNQMAVIALAEQNHLDALYHLYRAIAIDQPYPLAEGNLEIEFKKITTAWEKKPVSHAKLDSEATLILWFVRLHARFYRGADFKTHKELEDEVLSRLARLLKEQSFEITLEKLVIINIAAEYFAAERAKDGSADTLKSYQFLLQFNIRMIVVLLNTLEPELEQPAAGEELPADTNGSQSAKSRERITAITRRILPAIRQYSTWLVSRGFAIATASTEPLLNLHIKQMWNSYANVLTKIACLFPVEELSAVKYLLEEDEGTVGFKPLRDPTIPNESDLYTDENGQLKQRLTDPGVERNHPNQEMIARILDILLCALIMYSEKKGPIMIHDGEFKFVEERLQYSSPPPAQQQSSAFSSPVHANNLQYSRPPPVQSQSSAFSSPVHANHGMASSSSSKGKGKSEVYDPHESMEDQMSRMVENLVDGRHSSGNETSYGMHSLTANEIFAPAGSKGSPAPLHSTPKMLPSLPGLWQSAFTPQPNELHTSPNGPSSGRQLSPFQLSTNDQQMAAAASLEKMTGYDQSGYGSWGRRSRPTSNSVPRPAHQALHDSLAQQYMPTMQGSMFTDSSSIYANTPRAENRYNGNGLRAGPFANGNNTTTYAGASDFELQSSLWDGSNPLQGGFYQTPPGGQGG